MSICAQKEEGSLLSATRSRHIAEMRPIVTFSIMLTTGDDASTEVGNKSDAGIYYETNNNNNLQGGVVLLFKQSKIGP